jgi:hypothetical protein
MLMGDEDCVNVVDGQIGHQQPTGQLTHTQTTVDQQARDLQSTRGFDQGGIPSAAAA